MAKMQGWQGWRERRQGPHRYSGTTWAPLGLLRQTVVECSTLAGDERPVLVHLEQNWSMLEELEGVGGPTRVGEQTTSACQMIRSISTINLEFRTAVPYLDVYGNYYLVFSLPFVKSVDYVAPWFQ